MVHRLRCENSSDWSQARQGGKRNSKRIQSVKLKPRYYRNRPVGDKIYFHKQFVRVCKTVPREDVSTLKMGSGENKENIVIDYDKLYEYVGIGWVELRPVEKSDYESYPLII